MAIYIVGGAIRDLLLNKRPHDIDYVFSEPVAIFLAQHPKAKKVGHEKEIYIYHGSEYAPLFAGDIQQDLLNRDLTINALALGEDGRLYTHPETLSDLKGQIFRATNPKAFIKDPTRIFRLARFSAEMPTWTIAEATKELLASFPKKLLGTIAAERVGNELLKALASPAPAAFFELLATYDLLDPWFSELAIARNIPAGPAAYHSGTVFTHTLRVLTACSGDTLAAWMAICHDLGKITTEAHILPHHYGHEDRGIEIANTLANRLVLPTCYRKAGKTAAKEHMRGGIYPSMRVGRRRDLVWLIHRQGLTEPFWKVVDADSRQNISALAKEDLQAIVDIHLPKEFQNLGKESQEKLRMLQCRALALKVHGK